ncbi:hypothetical protein BDA96_08G167800, partial [Sorghum bicolor]
EKSSAGGLWWPLVNNFVCIGCEGLPDRCVDYSSFLGAMGCKNMSLKLVIMCNRWIVDLYWLACHLWNFEIEKYTWNVLLNIKQLVAELRG